MPNILKFTKIDNMNKERRNALKILGLSTVVAYSAPTVTRLDTSKAAFPSQCPGRSGGPGRGCNTGQHNGTNGGHSNKPDHGNKGNGKNKW